MAGIVNDFDLNATFGENGTGVLEIATNYDGTIFDDGDGTNESTQITTLETYTYGSLGFYENFVAGIGQGDERIINTDVCGIGELRRTQEKLPNISVDLQEILDMDNLALLLNASIQNVAGTLVAGATQVVVNPSGYLTFIKIANQNGDGSAITVNSVTGSTDGVLVAGTDYNVVKSGSDYGIELISGGAITTLTQTFTIDYDYTPNSAQRLSLKRTQQVVPGQLLRFTTCPDSNGKTNIFYFVNAKLNSDISIPFTNLANGDFAPTSITMECARGGNIIIDKQSL